MTEKTSTKIETMTTYEIWNLDELELGETNRKGIECEGVLKDTREVADYLKGQYFDGYEKTYYGIRIYMYVDNDDMLPNGDRINKTFHFTASENQVSEIIDLLDL